MKKVTFHDMLSVRCQTSKKKTNFKIAHGKHGARETLMKLDIEF